MSNTLDESLIYQFELLSSMSYFIHVHGKSISKERAFKEHARLLLEDLQKKNIVSCFGSNLSIYIAFQIVYIH